MPAKQGAAAPKLGRPLPNRTAVTVRGEGSLRGRRFVAVAEDVVAPRTERIDVKMPFVIMKPVVRFEFEVQFTTRPG